jgi:hypothetical protein
MLVINIQGYKNIIISVQVFLSADIVFQVPEKFMSVGIKSGQGLGTVLQ